MVAIKPGHNAINEIMATIVLTDLFGQYRIVRTYWRDLRIQTTECITGIKIIDMQRSRQIIQGISRFVLQPATQVISIAETTKQNKIGSSCVAYRVNQCLHPGNGKTNIRTRSGVGP